MNILLMKEEHKHRFIEYCRRHRHEVDESDLYDEDLEAFSADENNPTYVMVDEQGHIRAAASLIFNDYLRSGKRTRFRIFHSEINDISIYRELLACTMQHMKGLECMYLFVHVNNDELMRVFAELGFFVDRYSFFMVREGAESDMFNLVMPEHYSIRAFKPGEDDQLWCEIRNPSFASLKGSETPMTPAMVEQMAKNADYLDGGMMILYHGDKPVGVVRGSNDELDGQRVMNIGPVAVIPEYQGRGLGRVLLRAANRYALATGFEKTVLCVNADNERAKKLYVEEGFKEMEAVACFMKML